MNDPGRELPLGASSKLHAVSLTNADGAHAVLVRDEDAPILLVTAGTDARAGRVIVTSLGDRMEVRNDREAAAQWIASGSVARRVARVPAWANVIGFAIVLTVVALTVLGAATAVGWLVDFAT